MEKYSFSSNAKVSIYTDIVGKTDNGRWNVESIILPINIYDTININLNMQNLTNAKYKISEKEIYFSESCREVATVIKNLSSFSSDNLGIDIYIKKNIPISSGLGGESANTTTIIKALNIILDTGLEIGRLFEISKAFGRDAFFFIYNQPAYIFLDDIYIFPIENRDYFKCFIINPEINFSQHKTKEIMSRNIPINPTKVDKRLILDAWRKKDLFLINSLLRNFITITLVPEYQKAFEIMDEIYRIAGVKPQFTGTGPCMILFTDNNLEKILKEYCKFNKIMFYAVEVL